MATETLDWGAHARRELARTGHRAGGARESVLALLERQPCCLSAQELHDRLRAADGRTPGLASVYRALEVLTEPQPRPPARRRRRRLLRAGRPQRRAPPPRDLRPLRQARRVRGRRAGAPDRRRRPAAGLRRRRARHRAAGPLPRLRLSPFAGNRPEGGEADLSALPRVAMFVALSRLTRRQALKLGAAAAALGSLKPGSSALAAPRAEAFTLALPEHGASDRRRAAGGRRGSTTRRAGST